MAGQKIIENASGNGESSPFFVSNKKRIDTGMYAFLTMDAGTVLFEASADGVNYAPIKDGVFSASEVIPMELAEDTYFRAKYTGATNLNLSIVPKMA